MMTGKNYNDKTFIKVTNEDIYKILLEVKDHVKETNGKVKMHQKLISGLIGGGVIVCGWIISLTIKLVG